MGVACEERREGEITEWNVVVELIVRSFHVDIFPRPNFSIDLTNQNQQEY